MVKTDKKNTKTTSKKVEPIKASKDILVKVAALAKPTSKASPAKMAPKTSDSSSDASSSDESTNEESHTDNKGKGSAPVKTTPAQKADASDSSSDDSNSEESSSKDSDEEMVSIPAKTSLHKEKNTSDPEDDSSDVSSSAEPSIPAKTSLQKEKNTLDSEDKSSDASSEESSGQSDSDEDDKISMPVETAPAEANKKRKAESETATTPKKVKFANGSATSGEETKSIFVGRLSWNVDNDWLAEEFAECGEVESAHVQMDRNTGRSRGFGYVHFKTAEAVEKALKMNGKEIDGRAVNIDRSNSPDKKASVEKRAQAFGDVQSPQSAVLFVGNLSFGVNEDTLWETFGEHGDIKNVRIPTDRDTGKPKGFAYVEFSEVGAATKAHGALQGFELNGRSIRLDFSQPRDSAGGRGSGQGGRGGRGRGGYGGDRGGYGGDRGRFGGDRGGFGGDRGRGAGRGNRGGERGGRGRGRGARTGGITRFEGQKITFD